MLSHNISTLFNLIKYMKQSIQELALLLISEKNEANLKKLYERIRPGLINYSFQILKSMDAAEDVVSESFAKIWDRLDQYNTYWNFSTWAYKIVRNESLLYMRKSQNKHLTSFDDLLPSQIKKCIDNINVPTDEETKEKENNFDSLLKRVEIEIGELPDSYRDIMIDRELGQKQYKQIEKIHSLKKNTVKTKIRRARIIIKNNILEKYPDLVKAYKNF